MATAAASASTPAVPGASAVHEKFAKGPGLIGTLIFAGVAVGAVQLQIPHRPRHLWVKVAVALALGLGEHDVGPFDDDIGSGELRLFRSLS